MTVVLVAALVLTAVVVAGCGSSSSEGGTGESVSKGEPIEILSINDTTGPLKEYGSQHLDGLQAAADYFNNKGGIDGHEVKIKHVSSNGEPTLGVSELVKELAADPTKYTMVDAGAEGSEDAALIPALKRYETIGFSVTDGNTQCATNASTNCPNYFSLTGPNTVPEETLATFMKSKGVKHVGILEEAIDFTESETAPATETLEAEGMEVTEASFPESAVDLTSQMSQLEAAGVEAVFAEALGPAAGYTLKARSKLDWRVPVVFDIAASGGDITELVSPDDLEEAYETTYTSNDPMKKLPGREALLENVAPGTIDKVPLQIAGYGWDEVIVLANAIEGAGGATDAKSLEAALQDPSAKGKADPLYVIAREFCWTAESHENVCATKEDFTIIPVAPIEGGENVPAKSG